MLVYHLLFASYDFDCNLMFISTSKISKTTKFHEPEGQVQFVVFEKFTSAHYAKLQEKSCYYLLIMSMKKMKRQD